MCGILGAGLGFAGIPSRLVSGLVHGTEFGKEVDAFIELIFSETRVFGA